MSDDSTITVRLYVAGRTESARTARATIEQLAATFERGRLHVEVLDLLADPDAADLDDVFCTPTVVCIGPGGTRRLVGDLSSLELVMKELRLRSVA